MNKIIVFIFLFVTSIVFGQTAKKWSLEECVNYALENNLSIKRTEQSNLLLEENVKIAENNKLPSVSGSASQSINFGSSLNTSGARINATRRTTNFGINGSLILFNGFNIKNSLLSAQKMNEISKLDLEKMKNDISLNIVNSYLNILFQKENLKVANGNLEITETLLARTQQLVDAGTQPRGNLLEIEATKTNDENTIVTAENNIDLALLSLAQLLQIDYTNFDIQEIPLSIKNLSMTYDNTQEIYNVALTNQPEIKSAELNIENSTINVELAKSSFLPTVSLNGGISTFYNHINGNKDNYHIYNQNDPSNPILIENAFYDQLLDNNFGQYIGLNVSIPIFNKGNTRVNVNKAKISQEIAKTGLEDTKRALRENIERAYLNAKATLKEYEAAQKSLEAQELSFDFAKARYEIGATNSFDFDQVKNRLISARANVINAKYNFVFRTKVLEFYYGIPLTTIK